MRIEIAFIRKEKCVGLVLRLGAHAHLKLHQIYKAFLRLITSQCSVHRLYKHAETH